jgi:hypothetical protein
MISTWLEKRREHESLLFPLPGKNKIILHPLNEKNMTGIDT